MNFISKIWGNPIARKCIWIGGGLVVTGSAFLAYLGVCNCVRFKKGEFKERQIVYYHYQGNVKKIGGAFEKLMARCSKVFKAEETLGIYYDCPKKIADKNKQRMIVACVVEPDELDKIDDFL
jgi:hypothetical protein